VATQNPLKENITSQVLKGIKWSTLSIAVVSILQIGYTSVMARLLPAQVFGVLALATIVLRFGRYFAQMGVGPAIIQKKDMSHFELRAAFTSSLFLGLFFGAFFFLIAPLAGLLLKNEDVIPIIRVMSLSFVFTGLSTVSISLLRKRMRFQTLSVIEMIVFLISYLGVGIPMAINEMGVWSLAAAMLTQNFTQAVLTYWVVRHSVIPIFKWEYFKPLYSFGSKISLIGFVEFLSSSIDTMIIGRYLGDRLLGFYNRAFMLVNLPIEYLSGSFSKVLFPAFSKIQNDQQRLNKVYLSSLSVLVFLILSVSLGMAAAADNIVLVLLGKGWEPVIPILRLLAVSAGINFLSHYGGIICEARARLGAKFKLQVTYLILLAIGLFLGRNEGIVFMASVLVFAQVVRHFGYIIVVKNTLGTSNQELIKSYFPGIFSSLILATAIYFVGIGLQVLELMVYIKLTVQVITGAIGLIVLLKLDYNKELRAYMYSRIATTEESKAKGLKQKISLLIANYLKS
jgi:O-antigen/teichoic acid export membrane protein